MTVRIPTRHLAVCVILLLTACSKHRANPDVDAAVAAFDANLVKIEQWRTALGGVATDKPETAERDFRGRTIHDDVERWILSADSRRDIKDLRDRAAASAYLSDAQPLLKQAARRADEDAARGKQIWSYWNAHLPAPYWRRYWHDLYATNGVPEETPDSMLVSVESRIAQSLDRGDFEAAGKAADELNSVFGEATNRASSRIFKIREAPVNLAPRKTACPRERISPRGEKPTLVHGESVESFYPKDAITRGESGSVVLRARVNAAGCATSVAVQVHSGVPALDAAALNWFETASFTPGAANGTPVDSFFVWKIRFELRAD